MDETRKRLKELFLTRAVSFGTFALASGKTSSYYFFHSKSETSIIPVGEVIATYIK